MNKNRFTKSVALTPETHLKIREALLKTKFRNADDLIFSLLNESQLITK